MPSPKEVETFVKVLQKYGLYEPESLYKVLCPFHGDKNASMQINVPKAFFYCYGCNASGSTFELLKNFNPSLTPIEIYKKLHSITREGKGDIGGRGVYTPYLTTNTSLFVESKLAYKEGIKLAKDFYYNLPTTNWYKVPEEAIHIRRYMQYRGFTTNTLKKYEAKYTYKSDYPIVFPMYDNGIFKGYVMRTNDPFVEDQRKYMYNKGFSRRNTLPGDYKNHTVVLVEGFLDMLKAKQYGIKYVAAVLGWKLTSEQFEKLKKHGVKTIICALDNDECGRKGYRYLQRICKPNNIFVKRVRYPKKIKDMGDLSNENSEQILKQIRKLGGK